MTLHPPAPVDAPTLAAALEAAYRDHRTAPAIDTPSGVWSYEDLAANAHAVAAAIHAAAGHAAGGGTAGRAPVVAVVLERSPEFVAAVLGVLAAGAVYLPLDPDAPDAYLRQVLGAARPALVVTSTARAGRLRAATGAPVWTYPDLISRPGSRPEPGLAPAFGSEAGPSDPAYVIYTSGSTGSPKGVVVPHAALLNSTAARVDRYGPAGRVLLLHSPAFDLTTGILFWTLLTGGTLIIDPARLADVAATVDLVHRHQVTHLIYPASLYGVFLDRAATRAADRPLTTLTAVGIGSERWSPVLIGRHAAVLPATSLVNEYGPTEATVCSSYALVYDAVTGAQAPMSIGRPVRNTGYLILDRDGRPTTGTGELGITGANLALGYLEQPELTRQRFVTVGADRVYRTGDIVEQDPEGNVVFLHRADRQVQVGGHRVEPGHVETVLMSHPAVLQAHVTTRSPDTDSPVLVAYVVPVPGIGPQRRTDRPNTNPDGAGALVDDCDSHLRERLPAYLVPSTYVVMAELPRTPSGKIDSSALPDPAGRAAGPDPGGTGAGTDPLQRRLAGIAAEILGVTHIPPDRSLPALGANSLALIRLAAAIAADLGVDVAISALFTARTITEIADVVRDAAPAAQLPASADTTGPGARIPLSGQQQQIWVLSQLAPGALAYNTQFSLELDGPLDVDALQKALTRIVARHEILRTTFHDDPDGPVQVVHDPWPAHVEVVDLTDLDGPARAGELADRMRAAVGTGFDVAALPLVRWHLFRLAPEAWRLLQVEHHFAHDGWSAQLFLAELRDAYTAIAAGREPALPDLPAQYRDFAAWYRAWRGTGAFTDQVGYWRDHLDGCPADGATFAPDRPRPATRSFRGDRLSTHIPGAVVDRLDALAARYEVSRFAVFLTAFALQVWQHTAEQDVVLGSALLNRRQPGTDRLLGMFVNALPLRVRVDPAADFSDLLHGTMSVLLGAQDHQELPLLDLLAHLDRPRDPGRNPLFNLMFAFHDTPRPHLRMGAVDARLVIEHNATAKGDLNVVCVPDPRHGGGAAGDGPAGMTVLWEFDTDLFDRDTAAELLTGYETILTSVAALSEASDRPVGALDLLGADQSARILAESIGPLDPVPFGTLHAGFDAAVAAHPDTVAVEQAGVHWTYRQLADHANWLQRHLTARKIRAGAVVALVCPPGAELVAAILATLRAGAAYVCIDPGQPAARTVAMLEDAGAAATITTRTVADNLLPDRARDGAGTGQEAVVLYADDVPSDLPSGAGDTTAPEVSPDDPAYLVYTSGSTGTPKAVVATHRNACTAAHARTRFLDAPDAGPGPARTLGPVAPPGPVRTLVTLPVIFDVAPHMAMWTLWSGGTVVLPDSATQPQDPDQVLSLIERSAVTHVNFPASFYRQLLTCVPDGWRSALRVVAVGGEACRADDVREHAARLPGVALDHEYGPTETTVWCSAQRLHPALPTRPGRSSRVTVGRPLTNYTMTVLDPAGSLLPVGAAGELFVAGDAVAGYHRRPDLTRERFVTPTAGPFAGWRLYRTGDRARLTTAGFEILGRLDDQVKIRGFRVEPGEISACLLQHPHVSDAAVLVRGTADHRRLIAYIATAHGRDGLDSELRTWLAQRLPAYMLPAAYVITDRLPRTPAGKIQAGDLPEPADTTTHEPGPGSGPATDRQWLLAQVWNDVLQRPGLGLDDDFFASGGDSLQAIQAATRATALGVQVSVADILSAPTVRALDNLVTSRPPAASLPVVDRRPAGTALALTPIQMWFFTLQLADPDHFHQARLFEIPAHCDLGRLRGALAWAAGRHDAFRTRFTRTGAGWTAVLDDEPRQDLIQEHTLPRGTSRPQTGHLDTALRALHHPISIDGGRLAAVNLVHDPDGGHAWLYLIAHHLIVDVVSWQILTADIEHAYQLLAADRQLPDGAAPGMPSRDDDATDTAGEVDQDPSRWLALAAAAKPGLAATGTTTAAAPAATAAQRVEVHRRLSTRTGTYLRLEVPQLHRIGAQAVLLAGLRRALRPHSSKDGLYVWLEGHGRTGGGSGGRLDHVVGWLTNLRPVLFTVGDAEPARLVEEASSIHHQIRVASKAGADFGKTVLMHPGGALHRRLIAAGLPQITFNYLGQPADAADRMLQPAPAPDGAAIGARNVLPTPFDVTVAPALDGTVSCRFSIDPALLSAEEVGAVVDRFVAELETAARLVPLTAAPLARPTRTLVLLHPVGGRIDWYTHLVEGLGGGWDCYGIPRDRTGEHTTMHALAREYLARIRAARPAGSFTLAGWCLGGPLAYEIALQAQADGDGGRVEDVILIDPPRAEQPTNPHDVLITHVHNACPHQTRPAVVGALTATEELPIPQRAAALVDLLGPAGPGRPDHPLLGQLLMRLSDHAAMSAWRPAGRVPHLTLLLPEVVTLGNEGADETWCGRGATLTVATISGDHESMLTVDELHQVVAGDAPAIRSDPAASQPAKRAGARRGSGSPW